MLQQQPAFVAGATGYVGQAVVAQLAQLGHPVTAHVRPDSPRLSQWRHQFETLGAKVDSTAWEAEALARTFRNNPPSVVFCLIGTTRARAAQLKRQGEDPAQASYETVDYGLTALLLEAAALAGVRPRFVYLSALGTSSTAGGAYLKARWKAEEAVRASGLAHLIARPAIISGEHRGETRRGERLGAVLGDALFAVPGLFGATALKGRLSSIDAPTLARGLVHLALAPDFHGGVVHADLLRTAGRAAH